LSRKAAKKAVAKVSRYITHRKKLRQNGYKLVQVWFSAEDVEALHALEVSYPSLTRAQVLALAVRVQSLHIGERA